MSIRFGLIQELYVLDGTNRVSYGIAAFADAKTNGSATIVDAVRDITSNREKLAALIRRCNRLRLSDIHLHDVIEDFLASDIPWMHTVCGIYMIFAWRVIENLFGFPPDTKAGGV